MVCLVFLVFWLMDVLDLFIVFFGCFFMMLEIMWVMGINVVLCYVVFLVLLVWGYLEWYYKDYCIGCVLVVVGQVVEQVYLLIWWVQCVVEGLNWDLGVVVLFSMFVGEDILVFSLLCDCEGCLVWFQIGQCIRMVLLNGFYLVVWGIDEQIVEWFVCFESWDEGEVV